jgi:hypothetical protein
MQQTGNCRGQSVDCVHILAAAPAGALVAAPMLVAVTHNVANNTKLNAMTLNVNLFVPSMIFLHLVFLFFTNRSFQSLPRRYD